MKPAYIIKNALRFLFRTLACIVVLTTTLASSPFSGVDSSGARNIASGRLPNIVFILADDLGYHQLGSYGSTYYETPYLDQLAKEGLRFTNAYSAASVCSPTRASILTGKYPARINLTLNIPNWYKSESLNPGRFAIMLAEAETTIAELLQEQGYATGHFGKWHLNVDKNYQHGRPGDPGSQGFDDVLTTHKAFEGPESPYENDWYHVKHITERSLAFIEAHKDRPFFCYISHNAIHRPEIEKEELIGKYQKKPGASNEEEYGFNNPKQAAMLENLDKNIGRVIQKIEQLHLERETIIIFFSDNGHLRSTKDRQGFRGSKGDLHEGGIRVPLIVRWPGKIAEGSVNEEIVISNDFLPTFAAVADVDQLPKDVDGINLLPLMLGKVGRLERSSVFFHFPHYHHLSIAPQGAIRKGRYKLIENFAQSIYNEPEAYELYDLSSDPKETTNLADSLPEKLEEMKAELEEWRLKVGAQPMRKNK